MATFLLCRGLATACGQVRIICVMSCAPAVGRSGVVCGSGKLLRLRQSGAVRQSQAPAASRHRRSLSKSPHLLSAWRPPLNGFMPARLRLAAPGRAPRYRSGSLLPVSPASAPALVGCGHAKSTPGLGRRATERRSGPCGPRQPTPGRQRGTAQPKAAVPPRAAAMWCFD